MNFSDGRNHKKEAYQKTNMEENNAIVKKEAITNMNVKMRKHGLAVCSMDTFCLYRFSYNLTVFFFK